MSEQKPENKFVAVAKMAAICALCIGIIYGIVSLVTFLRA